MKRILFFLALVFSSPALAQNPQCPTRPPGDSTNACASTAFVSNAVGSGALSLANGAMFVGNAASVAIGHIMTGDCTVTNTLAITCTKTNGTSFGALAALGIGNGLAASSGPPLLNVTASQMVNVRDCGAMGNSTGTTGTGNDDTAAIQTCFTKSANSVLYFPCGWYRITSTVFGSTVGSTYWVHGDGICSKLYLDKSVSTNNVAIASNPVSSCSSVPPCFVVENMNFTAPTTQVGSIAIYDNNQEAGVFRNNSFNLYDEGIELTSAYGPSIFGNSFLNLSGAAVRCIFDTTCSSSKFWGNSLFNSGFTDASDGFIIGPNSGGDCGAQAESVSFIGNDIEGNYGGISLQGTCAVTIENNYIERNTNNGVYFQIGSGHNKAINIRGNWFFNNGSWTLQNVTGLTFENNVFNTQNITYGAGAVAVTYGYNVIDGSSSVAGYCSETTNCWYDTNGNLTQTGAVTTGSGTPGTASVSFPITCPNSFLTADVTSANGSSVFAAGYGSPSTSGMTVFSAQGPANLNWTVHCR